MYDAIKTREHLVKGLDELNAVIPDVINSQQGTMSLIESAQVFQETDAAI